MKKILRVVYILLGLIILFILGFGVYFNMKYPVKLLAEDVKVQATPQRMERGKYLTEHVTNCMDCHSKRDYSKLSGPVVPGTEGMGGEIFSEEMGFPGNIVAPNITPAGIGNYTDGELIRAFTEGIAKDGRALFPLMPYMNYRKMDKEDIYSIVTYIRSLKPIENKTAETKLNFPLNFIVKTMPEKNDPQPVPDISDKVSYGNYLVYSASCGDCHTPRVKGESVPGKEFAGGFSINATPTNIITTANITPDPETGIGKWTKEDFLNKFRAFRDPASYNAQVKEDQFQTFMPWSMFAGMTDEDLGAIYDYLRTVKPVNNKIEKFIVKKY